MVTVVIIIIKAVGVNQAHGAVDGLEPWIQTQEHQRKKPCRKQREERGRGGRTELQDRGRTVSNQYF